MRHALLLSTSACLCCLPAVEIAVPAAMPDAQAFVLVVVPDLRLTLTHLEQAGKAMGLPVQPGQLATAIGDQLGDPGLASLGQGPSYAIVAAGMPMPTWAIVLPTTKPAAVAKLLTDKGSNAHALGDQAVVIADLVGGDALAQRATPQIAALAKGLPAGSDARVLLAFDRVLSAYGPLIEMQLAQAGRQAGPKGKGNPAGMIGAIWPLVAAAANSFDTHQIDIRVGAKGLEFDAIVAAKPGSPLAKTLVAPAGPLPTTELLGTDPAATVMVGRCNPAGFSAMADFLAATVKTNPKSAVIATPEVIELLRSSSAVADGTMVARSGLGDQVNSQESILGITDAAKAEQLRDSWMKLTQQGAFADLMALGGMGYQITDPARKGAQGERIVRLQAKAKPDAAPEVARMVENMPVFETAIAGNRAIVSTTPADLDSMLAGTRRGGKPPRAMAEFGAGWDFYIDADLCRLLRLQGQAMAKANPGMAMFAGLFGGLQDGEPIVATLAARDGRVRGRVLVPISIARQITGVFMGMMGGGAAPEPAPAPAPAKSPNVF